MEGDSWSRIVSSSRRHQPPHQSRYGYIGYEEIDYVDDESEPRGLFLCPFCSEEFDVVGLCCHVDEEHFVEAKTGVCPVCLTRVGMDLVGHIVTHHENFYKIQQRRKSHKGSSSSYSSLSFMKREIQEGHLRSLFEGSSYGSHPSNVASDTLLSSFLYSSPQTDLPRDVQPPSVDKECTVAKSSDDKVIESAEPSLSEKDQEERTRRSNFVQVLLLSTIFEDAL